MERDRSVNPFELESPGKQFKQFDLLYSLSLNSWIKFEEDVEDGGNRWTKPFVGTLSLHALFELRSSLLNGSLVLDAEASTIEEVINVVADGLASTYRLSDDQRNQVRHLSIHKSTKINFFSISLTYRSLKS